MNTIEARNLAKVYRIYDSPVQRIKELILGKSFHRQFHALGDVSFSVPEGATFGIIGENGAGKSTLLKILSQTLKPTSGSITVTGKLAALLELGAGFNNELSGEENIFLNAYLIGLSKDEVIQKKEKIIQFSELGEAIKRPIKTYSSGMVIRLAFSIAVCVEPEVLILDEVLAVGDGHFQQKCIEKIMGFQYRRKTILFCSHNLYMINKLCSATLWLKNGKSEMLGPTVSVTSAYENYLLEKQQTDNFEKQKSETEKSPLFIRSITLNGRKGPVTLKCGDPLEILLEYECLDKQPFQIAFSIHRNDELICHAVSRIRDEKRPLRGPIKGRIVMKYKSLPFASGIFFVSGLLVDEFGLRVIDIKKSDPIHFKAPEIFDNRLGFLGLEYEWKK